MPETVYADACPTCNSTYQGVSAMPIVIALIVFAFASILLLILYFKYTVAKENLATCSTLRSTLRQGILRRGVETDKVNPPTNT